MSEYETVESLERQVAEQEAKYEAICQKQKQKSQDSIKQSLYLPAESKSYDFYKSLKDEDIVSVELGKYFLATNPPQVPFTVRTHTGLYGNIYGIQTLFKLEAIYNRLPEDIKTKYKEYKDWPDPEPSPPIQKESNTTSDNNSWSEVRSRVIERNKRKGREHLLSAIANLSDEDLVECSIQKGLTKNSHIVTLQTKTETRAFELTEEEVKSLSRVISRLPESYCVEHQLISVN